jgi:hypothetical protein
MNLTLGQKIAMLSVVLGVLAGGTAQLAPIVGHNIAVSIASLASLFNTIVSGWIFIVTGQGNMVKDVAKMPGVEKITVNAGANPTLASVAVDPTVDKVAPTRADMDIVAQTARGNT